MDEQEWIFRFSEKLKREMTKARMTQSDLAELANLSNSTVCDAMKGYRMPSVKTIVNIAYALDINPGDLIDFGYRIN